ncbi:MAG TPA: hypothetical protein VNI54_15940 [Thermoanaerobaculia bacterium]|nr:hypothetical protein [Thermoanaerobaculia bacterium]
MRKLLLGALVLLFTASAFAQQAPPQAKLTWVRYYTVERGREADFNQYVREYTRPMMERLVAAKKILGWGAGFPITMNDDPYTHVVWVALPDWSGAEAIGQAIEEGARSASPADAQKMMRLGSSIREGSMRDVILRHLVQSDSMPLPAPKYIVVDTYTIKPGRGDDAVALFNEWAKPTFDSVKSRMSPWGLSVQALPTEESWTHMVWYFISDLGALDALDNAMMSIEPRKLQGYDVRLRDMSDVTKQRSQIIRIMTP